MHHGKAWAAAAAAIAAQAADGGADDGLRMLLVGVDHARPNNRARGASSPPARSGSATSMIGRPSTGSPAIRPRVAKNCSAHGFGVSTERVGGERDCPPLAAQYLAHDEKRTFQLGAVDPPGPAPRARRRPCRRKSGWRGIPADGRSRSGCPADRGAGSAASASPSVDRLEAVGLPADAPPEMRDRPSTESRLTAAGAGEIGRELIGQGQARASFGEVEHLG